MGSKKPYLAAIVTQVFLAGMSVLSKAAFASGMNSYVFFFYRQAVAAVLFLPLLIIFRRKESRALSIMDFFKIFMMSLIGMTIGFNAYGLGVNFTSANLGSAAFNCLAVTTFLFSLIFRMEKLNLRTIAGKAKCVGLLVCIAGVAVIALYRGPYLKPLINHQLLKYHKSEAHQSHTSSGKIWIIGCLLLFITSLSWGLWLVLQAKFLKTYASPVILSGYQTIFSAVQNFVLAIVMERNPSNWKLGWNVGLIAVLYCGIFASVISTILRCWVIKEKGPVFYSMYTPFNVVTTIIISQLLLSEGINLGSLIGVILFILSLYTVLWGKNREPSIVNNDTNLPIEHGTKDFTKISHPEP